MFIICKLHFTLYNFFKTVLGFCHLVYIRKIRFRFVFCFLFFSKLFAS